jgi:hypothetical protein
LIFVYCVYGFGETVEVDVGALRLNDRSGDE